MKEPGPEHRAYTRTAIVTRLRDADNFSYFDACRGADALEELEAENDALRSRAEAAEKAIKEHNDGCVAACEARQRGDYGQDCSAWISRKRRCLDCARDSMIDYPAAIAAGGDDAKD